MSSKNTPTMMVENATWLLLEVSVNAIDKPIDTLDVIIDGKTIPANHWHGKIVTAFNVYFNVTEWQYKGKNQVELIAYVGGKHIVQVEYS